MHFFLQTIGQNLVLTPNIYRKDYLLCPSGKIIDFELKCFGCRPPRFESHSFRTKALTVLGVEYALCICSFHTRPLASEGNIHIRTTSYSTRTGRATGLCYHSQEKPTKATTDENDIPSPPHPLSLSAPTLPNLIKSSVESKDFTVRVGYAVGRRYRLRDKLIGHPKRVL